MVKRGRKKLNNLIELGRGSGLRGRKGEGFFTSSKKRGGEIQPKCLFLRGVNMLREGE